MASEVVAGRLKGVRRRLPYSLFVDLLGNCALVRAVAFSRSFLQFDVPAFNRHTFQATRWSRWYSPLVQTCAEAANHGVRTIWFELVLRRHMFTVVDRAIRCRPSSKPCPRQGLVAKFASIIFDADPCFGCIQLGHATPRVSSRAGTGHR